MYCPIYPLKKIQVMSGRKSSFEFTTTLADIKAVFMKTAIFLPGKIIVQLPESRVRVKGTMNGAPFAQAVQHLKDGSRYFSVSGSLRKAAGIKTGERVVVKFKLVDPDIVDMPEELDAVLEQDPLAMKAWCELTRGYQRGLIHYVTSVKNVDSRIKRSIELMERAKAGLLHGQKRKKK
jgi:hypothetical protein